MRPYSDADPETCDDNFPERGGPPVNLKEARAIADEVHVMLQFIGQVAERELASFQKGVVLEETYALLVTQNGQSVPIKFGTDEATQGAHAMLASLAAGKYKIILLRRNGYYIPDDETVNYVRAGCPRYKDFAGAKRQLFIDAECSVGSFQMLIKYEKNSYGLSPCSPELRCMHAASSNKWFKSGAPVAWFSDC